MPTELCISGTQTLPGGPRGIMAAGWPLEASGAVVHKALRLVCVSGQLPALIVHCRPWGETIHRASPAGRPGLPCPPPPSAPCCSEFSCTLWNLQHQGDDGCHGNSLLIMSPSRSQGCVLRGAGGAAGGEERPPCPAGASKDPPTPGSDTCPVFRAQGWAPRDLPTQQLMRQED